MDGIKVWFETEDETHQTFVHLELTDGQPFGKAKYLRQVIPVGTWIAIGPEQQPGLTWYFVRHCGFRQVTRVLREDGVHDVLRREQ